MYTCDDTRQALTRGELPESREAEEHLASCAACRELVASDAALGRQLAGLGAVGSDADGGSPGARQRPALAQHDSDTDADSAQADAWAALEAELGQEQAPAGWLRNRSTTERVGIALGGAAVLVAVYFVLSRRADWGTYPLLRWGVEAAALGAVLWVAVHHVLRPLHVTGRQWTRAAAVAAALALPIVLAAMGPAHVGHAASLEGSGVEFWPRVLACFAFGAAIAVPLLVVLQLGERLPGRRFGLAVLAAAAGGLLGNLVLHAHCAITDPLHLLLGHASVGVALVPVVLLVVWVRSRRA